MYSCHLLRSLIWRRGGDARYDSPHRTSCHPGAGAAGVCAPTPYSMGQAQQAAVSLRWV